MLEGQPDVCARLPRGSPADLRSQSGLTELTANVLFRVMVLGILEQLTRVTELDEIPGPTALRRVDVQEAGVVGNALRLLEIVRHDRDREALTELQHQLLDFS